MSAPRALAALAALAALCTAASCASPGLPPGGPPDKDPPKIVRLVPDTGAVNARPPRVVFQFDEVVSERPQNAASLAGLFLVSPRDGEPDVDWHRSSITIKPRRGFRANTVYTITMLPGLADLRGNVRKEGATAVFSTGPTIPTSHAGGIVFDWPQGMPAARPLVEAISRPDSVVYVTVADSNGRFDFPHLAPGRYTLRAVLDANGNRALDEREAWDSAAVTLRDSARVELLAFVHDTIGPGISSVEPGDSVTLRVTLDRPLDPTQKLDASLFALRAADSSAVPIAAVQLAAAFDSLRQAAAPAGGPSTPTPAERRGAPTQPVRPPARQGPPQPTAGAAPPQGDTTSRRTPATERADSIRRATAPKPSRPVPPTAVVVVVRRPLAPGASYRLQARDLRGLLGKARTSDRVFTTPKAAAPAPAAADTSGGRRPPPPTRVVPDPVLPRRPLAPADSTARPPASRPPR